MDEMISLWTKQCRKCEEYKDVTLFHRKGDGYQSWCKLCIYTYDRKRPKLPGPSRNEIAAEHLETGVKACTNCGEVKQLHIGFYRKARALDGRDCWCKACRKIQQREILERRYQLQGTYGPRHVTTHPDGKKICSSCGEYKPLEEFYANRGHGDRYHSQCKECCKLKKNAPNAAKGNRRHSLKTRYNITEEQYNAMFEAQGGVCAICRNPETTFDKKINAFRRLAIDHDHKTGAVRALLCGDCNRSYGMLREDPARIEALLQYAQKWQKLAEGL